MIISSELILNSLHDAENFFPRMTCTLIKYLNHPWMEAYLLSSLKFQQEEKKMWLASVAEQNYTP